MRKRSIRSINIAIFGSGFIKVDICRVRVAEEFYDLLIIITQVPGYYVLSYSKFSSTAPHGLVYISQSSAVTTTSAVKLR